MARALLEESENRRQEEREQLDEALQDERMQNEVDAVLEEERRAIEREQTGLAVSNCSFLACLY